MSQPIQLEEIKSIIARRIERKKAPEHKDQRETLEILQMVVDYIGQTEAQGMETLGQVLSTLGVEDHDEDEYDYFVPTEEVMDEMYNLMAEMAFGHALLWQTYQEAGKVWPEFPQRMVEWMNRCRAVIFAYDSLRDEVPMEQAAGVWQQNMQAVLQEHFEPPADPPSDPPKKPEPETTSSQTVDDAEEKEENKEVDTVENPEPKTNQDE